MQCHYGIWNIFRKKKQWKKPIFLLWNTKNNSNHILMSSNHSFYHLSFLEQYVCVFFLLFLSFHLIRIWSQISNHSFQIIQNDLLFKLIFSFNCRLFDCSFVAFLERHNSPIKFQKWWITNEEYWQNQAISILLLYRNGYGILDYKFHLI